MTLNIETVQPLMRCSIGLVTQLCSNVINPNEYALGYQWVHVKEVLGDLVHEALKAHDITLGKQYGGSGIDIRLLLSTNDNDDNYYEVCANHILSLQWSARKIKKLFKQNKLIIFDYTEGGYYISKLLTQYPTEIKQARDIIYNCMCSVDNSGDWNLNSIPANKRLEIPAFIYGTGTYYQCNPFSDTPLNKPLNKILLPIHKARRWRVEVLTIMEEKGLLDQTDWSLHYINNSDVTKIGSFHSSPALVNILHENEIYSDTDSAFIKKYLDELPKNLIGDCIDKFSDHMQLHNAWQEYNWYIGVETHYDKMLITEKTLKGYALGVPTISLSAQNFNSYLARYGFQIDGDYDTGETLKERVEAAIEHMQTTSGDKDKAKHNQMLLKNNTFLASLIVDPLVKLKRP